MAAHSNQGTDSLAASTVDDRVDSRGPRERDLRDGLPTEDMDPPVAGDRATGDHGTGDHATGDHGTGDHATGGHGTGGHGAGDRATVVEPPGPQEDISDRLVKARVKAALFQQPLQPLELGGFVVLEHIAAGGMGEVYVAYDRRLDRKVAIKLLRPDVRAANPKARERLLREAQILARVSHPNVVQVYDAGEQDDQVFIAMELVPGVSLSRWLGRHAQDRDRRWRSILDTFIAAGRGLAAVHQAGLLHRDFKPANVLVGDDGRVRVVDFGLARAVTAGETLSASALDPEALAAVRQAPPDRITTTGMLVGTPAYMAPEQLAGREADQRSDQFSFCVALYEALYGARPFRGDDIQSLRDAVAGGEVPAPSGARVPARVWRALARGLAADPDQRYPSMDALLADLAHDPARQRRRWAAAAALLLGGMLAGGTGVNALLDDPGASCDDGAEALAHAWSPELQAQVQSAFAATGLPYADVAWQSIDRGVEEYIARWQRERSLACRATHVRGTQTRDELVLRHRCLDRQADRLEILIDRLTRADAALLTNALAGLAFVGAPRSCAYTEAMARAPASPPGLDALVRVEIMRTVLGQARMLAIAGHFREALVLIDEQVTAAEALGHGPTLAEALYHAGDVRLERGTGEDLERGAELLQRALDLAEAAGHDALSADIWHALASRRAVSASPERAEFWARRGIAALERMRDYGMRRARALHDLGTALYWQQRYPDAERHQIDAMKLAMRVGATPLTIADMNHALANTLHARGAHEKAHEAYEEALELLRRELGDAHPRVQALRFDFADFLIASTRDRTGQVTPGALERAREQLETVRAMRVELYGPDSPKVAKVHVALASLDIQGGAPGSAETHARKALAMYERALGSDHPDLAESLMYLGIACFHAGRHEEALAHWQRERDLRLADSNHEPVTLGLTEGNIGEALVRLGREGQALAAFDRAQRHYDAVPEVPAAYLVFLHGLRGQALMGLGRPAQAVTSLEQALALLREGHGDALETADAAWALARALRAAGTGTEERARALAEEARAVYAAREHSSARAAEIDAWLRR